MKAAILGAGSIATKMAETFNLMDSIDSYAVASRDYEKAKTFAGAYKIPKAFGSYEEMLSDPQVELVYIATPHSHHYEQMKLCLEHGKHVLCEKAFTINAAQAKEILGLSKKKGLLVAEAIWSRYLPARQILNEILASGIIGEPRSLWANLCQTLPHIERLTNPALAGGALLDMGVYTLNFALMCFGHDIQEINTVMVPWESGVDALNSVTLLYKDGRTAILQSGFVCRGDRRGIIMGSKGYIECPYFNNCAEMRVYDCNNKLIAAHKVPEQLTGFEYETASCVRAIESGSIECPEMPHAEIITVMELMDRIRKLWGFRYPGE
jgi:predicted dehydrogenase